MPHEINKTSSLQRQSKQPASAVISIHIPALSMAARSECRSTMRWLGKSWLCVTLLLGLLNVELVLAQSETWRGLVVAPERRCSPYNRQRDYQYSQSIELDIIEGLGAVYSPYTGTCFNSRGETDIEHMVAASEAHDSGLCAADRATRRRFANDTRNLTLASPQVNRYQKSDKDAADWMPQRNKCWFAARVVAVRRAYNLTIDRREANALERVLSNCSSTAMAPISCQTRSVVLPRRSGTGESGPLELYDDNDNGRITCAEARAHGIAPVRRTHPAYRYMRDGDGDGVVCE